MDSCRVDNEERRYAEEQLAIFAREQFPQYVLALMELLVDTSKPTAIRQRGGYFVQDVDFRFGMCVAVRVILPERRRFKAEPA